MTDGREDVATGRRTMKALHLSGGVSFDEFVECVVDSQSEETRCGRFRGKAEGSLVCPADKDFDLVAV